MVSLPISVPSEADILVKVGDKITQGQLLAKIPQDIEHSINIAELLHMPAKKVPSLLNIQLGDQVKNGEIIAVKKNALGMTIARLKANVSGTVTSIDPETGILVIGNPQVSEISQVDSPIAGMVEVCNNGQIVIQTNDHVISGIGGIGRTIRGPLHITSDIDSSVIGKIVLGKEFNREVLIKMIGIGAVGIITAQIDPVDLDYLQQKNMDIPIVVVREDNMPALLKRAGKEVFIDGMTHTILLFA